MKASGMLHHLASLLLPMTRNRVGLVGSTVATGVALNGLISDQYLSIILTSDIYKDIYAKRGYESRLLSRAVEDSSTVTSPLFPVEQLRNDPGDNTERIHHHLPAILLLQHNQPADEHLHCNDGLQDFQEGRLGSMPLRQKRAVMSSTVRVPSAL